MKKIVHALSISATLLLSLPLAAQLPQLNLTTFKTGYTKPVGIFNAGDSRLFVIEQPGRIKVSATTGTAAPTVFLDITSKVNSVGNEQGLLGLAFSPDYSTNGHFFVNYTNLQGHTVIARYNVSADPDVATANSEQILLTINQPYSNHNGGNIAFGPDGYLYIGMGDGGNANDPQNLAQNGNSLLGKMLRIDVSTVPYSIPASNPFVGNATVADEVWAIGMRNPWRFSFDRATNDLWIADVGQNVWEEIDFEPANSGGGLNYGWRCYEANAPAVTSGCQPASNYTFPVYAFNHSGGACSVTGGHVYRGGKYGAMYGQYIYTDYCDGIMRSIRRDANGGFVNANLVQLLQFQYTSFGEDNLGELYVAARGNGTVYRVEETTCLPTAVILGDSNRVFCNGSEALTAVFGEGNTYSWYFAGQVIPGATGNTFTATQTGDYHVVVTNAANCTSASAVTHLLPYVSTVSVTPVSATLLTSYAPITLSGIPAGGTFSGPGISGSIFTPSVAGPGTHTITYTATGACGDLLTTSAQITVTLASSLSENSSVQQLKIYPNPGTAHFTVSFQLVKDEQVELEVVNLLGQVVQKKGMKLAAGDQQLPLLLPQAAAGLYQVRIKAGTSVQVLKLAVE